MIFDYFYVEEAESYSFYRIPKLLFTEDIFKELSAEAKILYGLIMDRISLSREHGWVDGEGRVYVYYTIENVKEAMNCCSTTACKYLKELEHFGLIEKRKQGLGKPAVIYVKNFKLPFQKVESKTSKKQNSGLLTNETLDFQKIEGINTKNTKTEYIKTDPILSGTDGDEDVDNSDFGVRERYRKILFKQLEIEYIYDKYPFRTEIIDSIVDLMLDVICTKRKTIRIAGDDKPAEVVKSQFLKLNMFHMEYIVDCILKSTSDVRNIKQYMLAVIYNAPLTMEGYFTTMVNHDMAEGKF